MLNVAQPTITNRSKLWWFCEVFLLGSDRLGLVAIWRRKEWAFPFQKPDQGLRTSLPN